MGFKVRRKPAPHPTCKRDDMGLVCGYPLPCPKHTIVITEDQLFKDDILNIDKLKIN